MLSFVVGAGIALFVLWAVSLQRRLVVLDENIHQAMNQIGVQLASRFDALTALLDLTETYAASECAALNEELRTHRRVITATAAPTDVLQQEAVITEALHHIAALADQYPQLAQDEDYAKRMRAVDSYARMMQTSRLIYNDSVAKLNRTLRRFPTMLVGRLLGFHQQDYLEAAVEPAKACMAD